MSEAGASGVSEGGVSAASKAGAVEPEAGAVEPEAGAVEPEAGAVEPELGAVEPELGAMDPEAGAVESDVGVAMPECNRDGNAGEKAYHKTWQAEDCDCVEGKYSTKYRDALRKFYYSSVDMRKKWPSEREKTEFQLLVDFIK